MNRAEKRVNHQSLTQHNGNSKIKIEKNVENTLEQVLVKRKCFYLFWLIYKKKINASLEIDKFGETPATI